MKICVRDILICVKVTEELDKVKMIFLDQLIIKAGYSTVLINFFLSLPGAVIPVGSSG